MTNLIEQLRELADGLLDFVVAQDVARDAADELSRLRAERDEMQKLADVLHENCRIHATEKFTLRAEVAALRDNDARLRAGLQYYADGCHAVFNDESAWDTVSGEPPNFLCDEAGTATIEDGSVAKRILEGFAFVESLMTAITCRLTTEDVEQLATRIIRNVCELPDRNSPEDEPDAMICNDRELRNCIVWACESLLTAPADRDAILEQAAKVCETIGREYSNMQFRRYWTDKCAIEIRALKSAPALVDARNNGEKKS